MTKGKNKATTCAEWKNTGEEGNCSFTALETNHKQLEATLKTKNFIYFAINGCVVSAATGAVICEGC